MYKYRKQTFHSMEHLNLYEHQNHCQVYIILVHNCNQSHNKVISLLTYTYHHHYYLLICLHVYIESFCMLCCFGSRRYYFELEYCFVIVIYLFYILFYVYNLFFIGYNVVLVMYISFAIHNFIFYFL